jgi:ribosomal protein L21
MVCAWQIRWCQSPFFSQLFSVHRSPPIYKLFVRQGVFTDLCQSPQYMLTNDAVLLVANMASYAFSSSLILVIHDNMINGTNHIEHVFVDISRSQRCQNTTCQISKVKNKKEKKKKGHRRMNRRYLDTKHRCNRRTSWYTRWKPRHRRMNWLSIF